jgi:hypothetical protein
LWQAISQTCCKSALSSFTSLGGTTYYAAAVSVVNGTLTFFMVGTDSRIWWRTTSQGGITFVAVGCTGHPAISACSTSQEVELDLPFGMPMVSAPA